MANFDFDFQRYIERRKGVREAEAREGAGYAYGGDLKVLRTLDRLRPVKLALEGSVGLWRTTARAEVLGTAIKVSEKQFPSVHALSVRAAQSLHIEPPGVFVSPQLQEMSAYTFGTDEEPAIVLHAALESELTEGELLFAIGHEYGHLQNHHVLFRTAHYFLVNNAGSFLRWIVKPAVLALDAWMKRGLITADRAGLLCARDVDVAVSALVKLAQRRETPATAEQPQEKAEKPTGETEAVARRVSALRVFSEGAYFRGVIGQSGGYPPEACDERVAEILSKGA
jgi:hypothetical protein